MRTRSIKRAAGRTLERGSGPNGDGAASAGRAAMSFGLRTAPGRRPTASCTRDRGSGSPRSGFPTNRLRNPLPPQDGSARQNEQDDADQHEHRGCGEAKRSRIEADGEANGGHEQSYCHEREGEPKREGRWSETDLRGGGPSANGCSGKTQGDSTERMPARNAWLEPAGMPVQNAFSGRAVIASGFASPDERPVSNSPL